MKTDERDEAEAETQIDRETLKDLVVSDDGDKVVGGAHRNADPDETGE